MVSRLDSFIRRLEAQRDCLRWACRLIAHLEGPIFELGFGNGRTYDYLRTLLPQRDIFVFDRHPPSDPNCAPNREYLILGELQDTLPAAIERFGRTSPLVHCDLGSGDIEVDKRLAEFTASQLSGLLRAGGLAVSDQEVTLSDAESLALPAGVRAGRYFIQRAA